MQLIDPKHPVYRHLWVRLSIIAVCFAWCLVEIFGGDPLWAVLSGACGVYALYMLVITYKPQPEEDATLSNDQTSE
ncbi:hypothetical protein [Oryzifoliimicrobium ureilyticus]|uniref:hypothetical protein n=1 Tax=Oryzifoliimicrobium ureilyticus TaxID=3113724 RepID=UPI0030763AC0